jgi:hypothetical protein
LCDEHYAQLMEMRRKQRERKRERGKQLHLPFDIES